MKQSNCQVFLGYRRPIGGSNQSAEFLFEYLENVFGVGSVFLDLETIPAGAEFPVFISNRIEQAKVFIVLIDSNWIDPNNIRRLNNKEDWVRKEIEKALEVCIPIIPFGFEIKTNCIMAAS